MELFNDTVLCTYENTKKKQIVEKYSPFRFSQCVVNLSIENTLKYFNLAGKNTPKYAK